MNSPLRSVFSLPFRLALAVALTAGATAPLLAQNPAAPTFANVSVHDPSVIKAGSRWYVYGSHGASAWTDDLMRWTQVATGVTSGNPAHFNTFSSELSEMIAWTNATTLWAADVIQLADGKFYYYYNVWTDFQGYRSYMGLATANGIEGPFTDVAELLKAGTGVIGFNPAVHPNTIDPDVFYDKDGQLWMVYGSYSGGIFILSLDQTVGSPTYGRPLPGQGWGTKLVGGNHANIEGPNIIYSPESGYYYLFTSFGGLAANGGYNLRVFRSTKADGPYFDSAGNNMATTSIPNNSWSTIEPYGVKIMGGCQFLHVAGEPQPASRGYVSPGHNSVYRDPTTGRYFLIFHTRFVGTGELHEVRVHQMWLNSDGWLVAAPQRYAGETIAPTNTGQIAGDWKLINHGKDITATTKTSTVITLAANGTVSGSTTGTWQHSAVYDATLVLGGTTYKGVFSRQWDDDNKVWTDCFSALAANGTAIWGSKVTTIPANSAPVFTTQPVGGTVTEGTLVTLQAGASGYPAPTFQWRKNGVNISGATYAQYSIPATVPGDTGNYSVVVTNGSGAVTSNVVTLTVNALTSAPTVTTQPRAFHTPAGYTATFTAAASGSAPLAYQWKKNGTNLAGATTATLTLAGVSAADVATYTVAITNAYGTTTSDGAALVIGTSAGRVPAISMRARVGTGSEILVPGLVVGGSAPQNFLVRALGPKLGDFGIDAATRLGDPLLKITLLDGTIVAQNDDWGTNANAAAIVTTTATLGAQPLTAGSKDAVLLTSLAPGIYTPQISGVGGTTGVSLVEFYNVDAGNRVPAISMRARVGTGSEILVPGLVVEGTSPKMFLIRALGPKLGDFGIDAATRLGDPLLKVTLLDGTIVAQNDNWEDGSNAALIPTITTNLGAQPLTPGSKDAVLLIALAPGIYTPQISGVGATSGVCLVEFYNVE